MTANTDLIKLYSERILALAADIPHLERLKDPDASVKRRSPLCGSTVTVDIQMKDGRINDYGQDVKACALGQAAASIVGSAVIGTTPEQIRQARGELQAMLKDDGPAPAKPFDELKVLEPAREFKNRHASILLTLDALVDAVDDVLSRRVSSEM